MNQDGSNSSSSSNTREPQAEERSPLRVSVGSGPNPQAESLGGVTRVAAKDLLPNRPGILATAHNPVTGGPPSKLTDDAVVSYGGMTMTLGQAVKQGLVHRDTQGNYRDLTQEEQDGQRQQEQQQEEQRRQQEEEEGPQRFSPEREAMAEHFASRVAPEIQNAVIEQVISGGLEGMDLKAAAASGMSPEEFRGGAAGIIEGFQRQTDEFVTKRGVNATEFYLWLAENAQEEMQVAKRTLVHTRNAKVAFGGLVEKYLQATTPDAAALNTAGLKTRALKDGTQMITTDGQEMTVQVAAKLGLI